MLEIEVLQLKSEIAELEIDQSTKTGLGQTWEKLRERVFAAGIYLDEIAYDRVTMLRARKVLRDSNVFLCANVYSKPNICQDRLGTNIGVEI